MKGACRGYLRIIHMCTFNPRHVLAAIALMAGGLPLLAQTCSDPQTLCPEAPTSVFVLDGADAFLNFDCIDATHVAVLRFRSNHNFGNLGSARIRITEVACDGLLGPDTLSAVVVSATGDPCDPAGLTAMGPCVSGIDDLVWESSTLQQNSEYFLLIGTQHDPADALCGMYVELEGDGVTLDACCNHTLISGASAELSVEGGDPVFGYVWSPNFYLSDPTQASTMVTPAETISYQVDGQIGECLVSTSVTVTVGSPIGVPNSFTPNGDNINDFWGIDGIAAFPGAKVEVFNRWGQLVHRSLGYAQSWDGTGRSGKPLTPGTYYYVIELNDADLPIPPETGHVAIIR